MKYKINGKEISAFWLDEYLKTHQSGNVYEATYNWADFKIVGNLLGWTIEVHSTEQKKYIAGFACDEVVLNNLEIGESIVVTKVTEDEVIELIKEIENEIH